MHSLFMPCFPLTEYSLKTRQGCEGDTAYTTPHSVLSGSVPRESSPRPDIPLPGSESSVASVTAELRLGRKRSVLFTHEATGINLTSSVVAEMLEEYYFHLHPKFPLLLDPVTVIDSYEKEPLLFWGVLAIASKDSEKHTAINTRLQILSRQLTADIILLGTRSIYLVQALLLLYVWSSPQGSMNKEPLSMYCALAISMARSLGLHRPQYPFPLFAAMSSEVGTLETRRTTWLSCFIVDQWHTARFGVPSSVRIDHTVLQALNVPMPGVPATTRIQLHIALVTSKISAALGECETSATGLTADPLPFVRLFETELGMIQDRYASEWSPADEVSFLDARLSLYSYVLDQGKNQPSESLRPVNEIITQSSVTARQLLIVVTTFPDILSKGIFHIFRSTSYAVFFLLRILEMAPSQFIDEAGIRNIIRRTFALMKDMSETGSDRRFQCVRVCRIIEHMIDYKDWDTDMPFTGKAGSFMANNFVADVAARGIIKANQRHSAARTERDCGVSGEAEVSAEVESDFNLDFSIWDPMEWAVNWQNIDDLLLPSENTRGFS
ncbi:hypothetical protein N7476_010516 [Penicillium atrosanguineum]|uniref:Xylanolytic transcriptional activator regulatory domain-containing protein n=1 Tax=Penicillium atrosanguineum TaxID=1132637 RepID=A0A9W9U0V8_9EURO|nr:hypothetical protein N7526_007313 [Penicillium atrosanguineum]KAJ5303717.1 hypothetical protein N7476_010516 [Penicillium atrosanguineum]